MTNLTFPNNNIGYLCTNWQVERGFGEKAALLLVNKDEKRKVKVGLSDYKKVEILEGLQANETLYKPN